MNRGVCAPPPQRASRPRPHPHPLPPTVCPAPPRLPPTSPGEGLGGVSAAVSYPLPAHPGVVSADPRWGQVALKLPFPPTPSLALAGPPPGAPASRRISRFFLRTTCLPGHLRAGISRDPGTRTAHLLDPRSKGFPLLLPLRGGSCGSALGGPWVGAAPCSWGPGPVCSRSALPQPLLSAQGLHPCCQRPLLPSCGKVPSGRCRSGGRRDVERLWLHTGAGNLQYDSHCAGEEGIWLFFLLIYFF